MVVATHVGRACATPALTVVVEEEFDETVDIYQQATRSVKYGFLFIVLSFAAFFVFEQFKNLRIHPIQYALVGLTQAVFFLLLTSLSEHMEFAWAYGASATASVVLGTRKVDWYRQAN